jgi:flavin reductase (DIM6/NTAB) family NADH-FMN oxidoreductase RutF
MATAAVEESAFRRAMGAFPAGVSVVATYAAEGSDPHGMTASSFLSVSLRPMLVLVSVAEGAHMHALLERATHYSVSLLHEGQRTLARRFAGAAAAGGEGQAVRWREVAGVPVLDGSCAQVVAEIRERHRAGDHTLFLGEVRALEQAEDAGAPLAYREGRFGRVAASEDHWVGELDPWGGSHTIAWG